MSDKLINFNVPLNKKRQNANIMACELDDAKMRKLGFTDNLKDRWYLSKIISNNPTISFNITIKKSLTKLVLIFSMKHLCKPTIINQS